MEKAVKTMATAYRDYAPTGFDPRGLGCDEQQDWLVAPCMLTRDSGARDTSNWRAMLAILDDKGLEHEIKRFGHWGPGWIEIALVAPSEAASDELDAIEGALAHYPVLDDSLCSELESEELSRAWDSFGCREFVRALCSEFELSECTRDWLDELASSELMSLMFEYDGGCYSDCVDDLSCRIEHASQSTLLTRTVFATWMRKQRAALRPVRKAHYAYTLARVGGLTGPLNLSRADALGWLAGRRDKSASVSRARGMRVYSLSLFALAHELTVTLVGRKAVAS